MNLLRKIACLCLVWAYVIPFVCAQTYGTLSIAGTGNGIFKVYFTPSSSASASLIGNSLITIKAPAGGSWSPASINSVNGGNWRLVNSKATVGAEEFVSFGNFSTSSSINWNAGQQIELFNFQNSGSCASGSMAISSNANLVVTANGQVTDFSTVLFLSNNPAINAVQNVTGSAVCQACTPPATPALAASPASLTNGQSSTLTVSNCAGTVTWGQGLGTGGSKTVSPTATTTYTATCTVNGCTSGEGSVTVSVIAGSGVSPTSCINLGDQCSGNSAEIRSYTLTMATSGSRALQLSYRAHEGNSSGRIRINGGSWQSFSLPQTSSSTYQSVSIGTHSLNSGSNTIELSSGGGFVCFRELCTDGGSAPCTPPVAPALTASAGSIPSGQSSTLTASNCAGTVNWGQGLGTGGSKTVSPTATTTYTATCTVNGCTSGNGSVTVTVTVAPCTPPSAPTLTASAGSIPSGQSSTLTASNCAGTVTWSSGLGTGASKTVSPTATTTYTATCTVNGCTSGNGSVTVTVTAAPTTPTEGSACINLGDQCSGNSAEIRSYTLTVATSGSRALQLSYRAHEGNSSGRIRINGGSWQSFSLPQTSSSTYQSVSIGTHSLNSGSNTIELSSGGGFVCFRELCTDGGSAPCTPPVAPALTASAGSIPSGQSSTLTASNCAGTVNWGQGLGTGGSKTVSPTATTTYTATCTVNGCTSGNGSVTVTVTVAPCTPPSAPTLTASAGSIPSGQSSTLTASNCAGTVTWSSGLGTGASKTVSPTATTTYTATCTVNGCTSGNGSVTVTVTAAPTTPTEGSACINLGDQCSGNSAEIRSYTLTVATSGSRALQLSYRAHEGNSSGRIRINGGSWQSFSLPQTSSSTYQSVSIGTHSLNGGNNTIELSSGGGFVCFRELCTDGGSTPCTPPSAPTLTASAGSITSGQSSTLTASNCAGTVNWGQGLGTGGSKTVSPTATTTYSATCTVNGCTSGNGSVTVTVTAAPCTPPSAPTLTASAGSIPSGQSSTLTASNCAGTVTWSSGLGTGASKTVSPTATTTYTATCTVNGCTSGNGSVTVTVTAAPTTPTEGSACINLGDQCSGNSAEIRSYTLTVATVGSRALQLSYRAHEKPSTGRIRINGGSWQSFSLPQTSSSNYQSVSIGTHTLNGGNNTIELSSGDGFVCFRELCTGSGSASRIGVTEDEPTMPASLTIYPNPTSGEFQTTFFVEKGRKAMLIMTDMLGRQVYGKQFLGQGEQQETIRLVDQSAGIYLMILRREAEFGVAVSESKKVMIVK